MDLTSLFLLATLEGFTEFLPISSTAHLILLADVLRLPSSQFLTTFSISIQLGAILSVTALYYRTLVKHPRLLITALVAFLPAGLLGFIFYSFITETLFENPLVIIATMGVGGIALIAAEKFLEERPPDTTKLTHISYKKALGVGLIQTLSLIPGTSRAASSMVGGLFLGLDRKTAVEFSFLLALPTIGAATALDLIKHHDTLTQNNLVTLAMGCVIAFAVAYLTMKYFLKFLNASTLVYFGIYRIAFAFLAIIAFFM